ncbi:MAG TPA: hypothetical protein VFL41_03310 [Gaiellaceae bacterium]|nr:hypothetical protein [Gaiellaceae bacterium]
MSRASVLHASTVLARSLPAFVLTVMAAIVATTGMSASSTPAVRNGLIVFVSKRDGDAELFTIRPDGGGLRRLTRNRVADMCPAWSPGGRLLAFARARSRAPWGSDLFVMRADGRGLRRVLRSPGSDNCPSWSPDGRRLAFHRGVMAVEPKDRVQDIFTVGVDGRGVRRLTTEGDSYKPSWSSGNRIAWHYRATLIYYNDIFTMKPDGSDRRRLTDSANNDDPDWSPDGRRVLYAGQDGGDIFDRELFVVSGDGTGRVRVTEDEFWDWDPAWSPDGRWIVCQAVTKGRDYDLYVVRADGSGRRRLTSARAQDFEPDWAPAR